MKRFYKIIFVLLVLLVFSACSKDYEYNLIINEDVITNIYLCDGQI